jgi:UDP-glucose 4-epimerase
LKILVTGGAGFIGSNLCEALLNQEHDYPTDDHQVICFDDLSNSTMENIRSLFSYKRRFKFIRGDIRDKEALEAAAEDCTFIAHLAAQIHVDKSTYDVGDTISRNIDGTVNVLELSRRKDIPVVFASSSEIYGTAQYPIMDETHPTNPQSIYAASKLAGDRLCHAYYDTYDIPVTVLRQFNTYGPRQADTSYGGVISIFTRRVLAGKNPLIFGSGEASRDYTYIDDVVEAYMKIIGNNYFGKFINYGTGEEVSVLDLAKKIINICGMEGKVQPVHVPPRPNEVMRLCCDNRSAKILFNTSPRYGIDEGLNKYIEWYKGEGA